MDPELKKELEFFLEYDVGEICNHPEEYFKLQSCEKGKQCRCCKEDYDWNIKRWKEFRKLLVLVLNDKEFEKLSCVPCDICKIKLLRYNTEALMENEKLGKYRIMDGVMSKYKSFETKIIHLCDNCKKKYKKSKKPIYAGFEKAW